jgi:hypothetical protein
MKRKINRESEENWSHKNDYLIEEVWNTYHTLAQLIVPRLQAFKALDKHGYCPHFKGMREWNNAIQKMIDAFELLKYNSSFSEEEQKTIKEGLDLFCKHYRNLWD